MGKQVKRKRPASLGLRVLKRGELFLRIIAKGLLVTPILTAMVLFNFNVDRSGLFHVEPEYETYLAQAIINGEALSNDESMDERPVYAELARTLEEPYDTIALGSSRVLQLRSGAVGGSFMNCGMSNADYRDLMSTFYLFDRAGKLPKNLILCIDPGLLYGSDAMLNSLADKKLFDEFLQVCLGIDTGYKEKPVDNTARLKALVSPSYLQGNIRQWLKGPEAIQDPGTVREDELMSQHTDVKLGDGSVLYKREYREMPPEKKELVVHEDAGGLSRLYGYNELNPDRVSLFDQFIAYVQSKDINVVFLLPPYHPRSYYFLAEHPEQVFGFFEIEKWLREYAVAHNIAMYGSYNPFVGEGFYDDDFYDGLHPKPEVLERIFPGIEEAVKAINSGNPTDPRPYGGETVSEKTAEHYVIDRYDQTKENGALQPKPGRVRRLEDEKVEGIDSYVFGWFDGAEEEESIRLGRFAVTKDAGLVYRFDDEKGWVIDARFDPL